tara:strand:- start:4240 stop:4788 length:549 start_codon:yes stop_codon:yes gene_type:complete
MNITDLKLLFEKIDLDDFKITDKINLNRSSLTYGEVSNLDIGNLISSLKINCENMLDVGSGCGKLVIYLAITLNINIDGIEIDKNRFNKSEYLLEIYDLYDKVNFINDTYENLYFGNYDLIYCCNLVFEYEDNIKLYNKIKNEFNGIFILFEYDNILLPYLKFTKYVKTSWEKTVIIYIFKK